MVFSFLFILLVLAIYSYSQIDLNLTLLQSPLFLKFQFLMVQLGYYQRVYSVLIFTVILLLLFTAYLFLLRKGKTPVISLKNTVLLIGGVAVIGVISYPAFSYDLFNYIFDARIVTFYHQNPYLYKALDFPSDNWIRFMHWTHRTYPYGPVWLLVTLPFSFLGFGRFLLTLVNFKVMFSLFYLGNCYLIYMISSAIDPKNRSWRLLFFALNPLVIIESVVSPHIDSVMAFFTLLSVICLIKNQRIFAFLGIILSGGIKFLSWILIPLYLLRSLKIPTFLSVATILTGLSLIPVIIQREFYPWYFLPAIALLSLKLMPDTFLMRITLAISAGLMLRYIPFLYVGYYSADVLLSENILLISPLFFELIYELFFSPHKIFHKP